MSPSTSTRSTGTTVSAPSGTTAPVEISIASPGVERLRRRAGLQRHGRRSRAHREGRQSATAYPSIDELAKRRHVDGETRPSAATRPAACCEHHPLRGKRLGARENAGEGLVDGKQRRSRIARYTRRTGYPRVVISVVIPVHDEERSVALLYDELAAAFAGDGLAWEAVFVDDGSTDGTFGALTRLHDAQRQRPRRPLPTELRQGRRARRRVQGGRRRRSS